MTTTNYLEKENVRMNIKFSMKRLLMSMIAIMMAMATFTACEVLNPKDDDENDDNGGVAGKRLKSTIITEDGGEIQSGQYTYNSDGTLKRIDWNNGDYQIITSNSDGTWAKVENFNTNGDMVLVYSNDANKKPLKAEGTIKSSNGTSPITYDYTFQNGRLILHVQNIGTPGVAGYNKITSEQKYDSNGRRTTTTETHSLVGERQFTRTYNSDGTLQKVTTDGYTGLPTTGFSQTFTWENGKTKYNFDDYYLH